MFVSEVRKDCQTKLWEAHTNKYILRFAFLFLPFYIMQQLIIPVVYI